MTRNRRATLSDVARAAGVSPVTVSRAIRQPDMVSEVLRQRVSEAVAALHYIPNTLASALASTRTNIVGVIVPSLTNGVFDDYVLAIEEVLQPAGFQVLVLNVHYSELEEERAIQTLMGYHPEAMIITGVDQTDRARQLLGSAGVPVVQTMDVTDDPIDLNIGLDHGEAGAAAVRYLHGLGHERIAHLTARGDPRARRRHAGYLRQMRALGLSTLGLVQSLPRISNTEMGRELFSKVLADVPDVTAVFTCNDDLALGTLFECQSRGMRVPEDIAIVGFNDLDFCVSSVPPLTSVSTGRRQMGQWAAQSILEIIRGTGERPEHRSVDLGFEIMVRGSSGQR